MCVGGPIQSKINDWYGMRSAGDDEIYWKSWEICKSLFNQILFFNSIPNGFIDLSMSIGLISSANNH